MGFQTPRGEGVVQTQHMTLVEISKTLKFQSPLGEGVVQTAFRRDRQRRYTGFNHLAVRGWFRPLLNNTTKSTKSQVFQSPRGEGVVQTANPRARMVMRQTGI